MVEYLDRRIEAGQVRRVTSTRLAARLIIETCTTWAIHIKWDRSPEVFDEDEARENVVSSLTNGLAL